MLCPATSEVFTGDKGITGNAGGGLNYAKDEFLKINPK
jgi:hypothetical protein